MAQTASQPSSPLRNLIIDVALPVLILNKLGPQLGDQGALKALLIAISLPLGHGLFALVKTGKINWISVLGLLNVAMTGGFALLKLEGFWFAVKEASFPLLIGSFVLGSAFTRNPLFNFFIESSGAFAMAQIEKRLNELNQDPAYRKLLRRCTLYFSATFFLSALLNFILALEVFAEIPPNLTEDERASLLNGQIADMTWRGYLVIALPLMILTASLFYYCLRQLAKMTDLSLDELLGKT